MPTASVTAIGLAVGVLSVLLVNRGRAWQEPLRGLAGAWAGFLGGALAGVIMDVMLGTGVFVALVGHALAVLGALVAVAGIGWTRGQRERDPSAVVLRAEDEPPAVADDERHRGHGEAPLP